MQEMLTPATNNITESSVPPNITESKVFIAKDPKLTFQDGAAAFDPISIYLALRRLQQTFDVPKIYTHEVIENIEDGPFAKLVNISVDGRQVNATIDTGNLKWCSPDTVEKSEFDDYEKNTKQSATFTEGGTIVKIDEYYVSRQPMYLPSEERVYMWFAELPKSKAKDLGRYTLVSEAQKLTSSFDDVINRRGGDYYDKISVPAIQVDYKFLRYA